jgi:hypothetical protein
VVVDVWESVEDFHKMVKDLQAEYENNPEAAGWQPEPQVLEIYEVHATIPWVDSTFFVPISGKRASRWRQFPRRPLSGYFREDLLAAINEW